MLCHTHADHKFVIVSDAAMPAACCDAGYNMIYGMFHGYYKSFDDVPKNEDSMAFEDIYNKLSSIIYYSYDFNKLNYETYDYLIFIGLNYTIKNGIINLYEGVCEEIAIRTYNWILEYYIQCPVCNNNNKYPGSYQFRCFNCKSLLSI